MSADQILHSLIRSFLFGTVNNKFIIHVRVDTSLLLEEFVRRSPARFGSLHLADDDEMVIIVQGNLPSCPPIAAGS